MGQDYVSSAQLGSNRPVLGSVGSAIDNIFTGNLDYERYLETLGFQNAFNAEQAQLARDFSAEEAEKTRLYNSAEAEKNRQWQEMMSNSAYQRAFADMKKAGLNPYLAYSQGGASSPAGSSASSSVPSSMSAGSGAGQSFNSSAGLKSIISGLFRIGGTALGLSGNAMQMQAVAESRPKNFGFGR